MSVHAIIQSVPTAATYRVLEASETKVTPLPGFEEAVDFVNAVRAGTAGTPTTGERVLLRREPSAVGAFIYRAGSERTLAIPAFAEPTPFTILLGRQGASGPSQVEGREPDEPSAFVAFKNLGDWLAADDAAIADMVGIGRTTAYTWKRDGREPRVGTAQRIYEYEAALDSVRRQLGDDGLRRWLYAGAPTRRETLLAGDLQALDRDVHDVVFRRLPQHRVDLSAAPTDVAPIEPRTNDDVPPAPSGRRPRRLVS